MAEIYVTLAEAAELEQVSYNTMVVRIKRNFYSIKREKPENGGRDNVYIEIHSLSSPARERWRAREKLKEETRSQKEEPEAPTAEEPWYLFVDLDRYEAEYSQHYYKAIELKKAVEEYLAYGGRDKTGYAEDFAQEHFGKNARTLYRYVKAYKEAEAWKERLEASGGGNYEYLKILCLCRKPKELGTFPSLTPEMKGAIAGIWFDGGFARNRCAAERLYEDLLKKAPGNDWGRLPSRQTVGRYIRHLMEDENLQNARFLASKGTTEYKNKVMVKGSRNTKKLKVMDIVMGDTHTFDFWVLHTGKNGKAKPIRPKLVVWIDVRSKAVMGDVVCKEVNADILKQSLLKMMFSDPGGVPGEIYIDNGRDYTAKEMTGRNRKERSDLSACMDESTEGFYMGIGTKRVHRALPYQPWAKGQVERFFKTVCEQFSKRQKSYTGTLTGSGTDGKVDKDIEAMAERGELLTMEQAYEKFHGWLTEIYMKTPHSGLKRSGEEYTTPLECFRNGERFYEPTPSREQCRMIMMKKDKAYVYKVGIKRFGHEYRSDPLCDYIGRKVDIKYDPNDVSTLYVYYKGRKVCEAYCRELLDFAEVSENVLEHIRMQDGQLKRDRDRLEGIRASVPKGFKESFGGGLTEGNKPHQKVVRFPEPEYQEEMRKKKAGRSEYLSAQAEKGLERLRKLGG